MKKFFLQAHLFVILFFLSSLPYIIMLKYLPFQVEYLYLFFIILLLVIRIGLFTDTSLKIKLGNSIREELRVELGKIPSTNQIVKREMDHFASRDLAFSINVAIILFITALFGKF